MAYNFATTIAIMKHLLSVFLLAASFGSATAQYLGGGGKGNTTVLVASVVLGTNSAYTGGANDGTSSISASSLSLAASGQYTGGQGDGFNSQLGSSLLMGAADMYAGGANDGVHSVSASALSLVATDMYGGGGNDGFNSITVPSISLSTPAATYAGGGDDGTGNVTASTLPLALPSMYAGGGNDGVNAVSASSLSLAMPAGNMYTGGGNDGHAFVQAILQIALPVIWQEFTASKQDKNALLHWKVANENGTEGYQVERSFDGLNFSKCGYVASKGNIFTDADYYYTDADPVAQCHSSSCNKVYYRIKQLSYDNKFSLSSTRDVVFDASDISVVIYPNPATDKVTIRWNLPGATEIHYDVALYNSTGALMISNKGLNGVTSETDVTQWPAGSYYIRITTGSKTYIQEITIIH